MTWKGRPDKEFQKVQKYLTEELQKKALATLSTAVGMTPAATGRLKGNWQVGVGRIKKSETGRLDKEGGPTISAGSGVIKDIEKFGDIYIANGVEYGIYVEAWAGMMRTAAARNR